MERRRFIPSSLSKGTEFVLEQRTLLSASPTSILGGIAPTTNTNTAGNLPQNLEQRLQRIANLPFFLTTYQPNRSLPASVTAPIQDDLRLIVSRGHDASQHVLREFNLTIRSVDGHASLSPHQAASLVNAFDAVLQSTGIANPLRSKFTEDMRALAKLDSNGPKPVILATNDFGLITQLVQAVAQPFAPPGIPSFAAADKSAKQTNVTHDHVPTFVGNAPDGVLIRIVDSTTFAPLGVGTVTTNGRYSVKLSVPLADGSHSVQAQTLDNGYESTLSHRFTFRVVSVPVVVPKGPRH